MFNIAIDAPRIVQLIIKCGKKLFSMQRLHRTLLNLEKYLLITILNSNAKRLIRRKKEIELKYLDINRYL
jgi:hypothetical protein